MNLSTVVNVLQSVFKAQSAPLELHEPVFRGNEWAYVKDCLDTGWVSSVGKYVDRFEQTLAEMAGVRRAVAVVNGTAALHIGLELTGVKTGDEILVTALNFVASANAITYCGAIPHFVDSDETSLGLDPRKLDFYLRETTQIQGGECINKATGRRIRAVIAMHTYGHPVDLDPLVEVCERHHLQLVEDAAESLGSYYKGRHTGNWGRLATLSFNGNKVVTTGGGGAILTNDEELGKRAKHLTTTAKIPHAWAFFHDEVGYNYRLPNINAALGCAQLEQLPGFLTAKRRLAEIYQKHFEGVSGLKFFTEPPYARSNYWLNLILLDSHQVSRRDDLLKELHTAGFRARPAWTLMHKLPMYRECPRMDLSVAESLESRLINLPSGVSLAELAGVKA